MEASKIMGAPGTADTPMILLILLGGIIVSLALAALFGVIGTLRNRHRDFGPWNF